MPPGLPAASAAINANRASGLQGLEKTMSHPIPSCIEDADVFLHRHCAAITNALRAAADKMGIAAERLRIPADGETISVTA